MRAHAPCKVIKFRWEQVALFLDDIPQFNYLMRKFRVASAGFKADWLRGAVQTW
jgi:hypothetical protein